MTFPMSPYGLSKLTAESYIRLIGDLRKVPFTIIRPANVYGPRQVTKGEGAVVAAFLEHFFAGRDPVIHGDGRQTRDFLFVGDLVRALIQALDRGDGQTLNVSTAVEIPLNELWAELAWLVSWPHQPVFGPDRPGDIRRSVLVNTGARRFLEWEPQTSLADGLRETVAWWRSHMGSLRQGNSGAGF